MRIVECSVQGRGDFSRMMCVIVHNCYTIYRSFIFESAVSPAEVQQRCRGIPIIDAEQIGQGDCSEGVGDIVFSGNAERKLSGLTV